MRQGWRSGWSRSNRCLQQSRSRLRRIERAAEILGAVVGRYVDLDQLQIVGARDYVVRDARRLRQAGAGLYGHIALDAGEAERDPAFQDHDEMPGHVVPVPAGRLLERPDRADVLGADPSATRGGKAEIAILVVGARAVAGEALLRRGHLIERGVRMRELERTLIAHRRVEAVHDDLPKQVPR